MVYDTYSLLNANADTLADDIIATFNIKVSGTLPSTSLGNFDSIIYMYIHGNESGTSSVGLQVWVCDSLVYSGAEQRPAL